MVELGDSTHLRGMRGTAVGVEAAVMTCRICSSAERPPPTWKATWSALFCWGKDRERGFHSEDEAKSGCYDSQAGRGFTRLPREGEPLFLLQEQWIEIWNKVIPKVFLFNLKSAQANSTSEQSSFNSGQMLCRLKWALGWSQPNNTGWRETEEMACNGPENCCNTSGYKKVLENYYIQKNDWRVH